LASPKKKEGLNFNSKWCHIAIMSALEASLGYIPSSRPIWTSERKPISKKYSTIVMFVFQE
jgi:hypothetical protein